MAQLAVILTLLYVVHLFALSRRRRPELLPAPDDLLYAFVIPCLNEEAVIGSTLESLLALHGEHVILVVDDGSDDRTGEIAASFDPRRVQVLRRELPHARNGKGNALNAAIRHLRSSDLIGEHPHDKVVVSVFDADGRIGPEALDGVGSYFRDPHSGAVQIGVEMRNAEHEPACAAPGHGVHGVHGDLPARPRQARQRRAGRERPVRPADGPRVARRRSVDGVPDRGPRPRRAPDRQRVEEPLLPDRRGEPAGGDERAALAAAARPLVPGPPAVPAPTADDRPLVAADALRDGHGLVPDAADRGAADARSRGCRCSRR